MKKSRDATWRVTFACFCSWLERVGVGVGKTTTVIIRPRFSLPSESVTAITGTGLQVQVASDTGPSALQRARKFMTSPVQYSMQSEHVEPGRVLLNNIVAALPDHYNLSIAIRGATKETEPRASGGNCDVTFGAIPWADVEKNCQTSSHLSFVNNANDELPSLKIAIKRARAHILNSLSPDKREKFIKVCLHQKCKLCTHWSICLEICQGNQDLVYAQSREYFTFTWLRGWTPHLSFLDNGLDGIWHCKTVPSW